MSKDKQKSEMISECDRLLGGAKLIGDGEAWRDEYYKACKGRDDLEIALQAVLMHFEDCAESIGQRKAIKEAKELLLKDDNSK